jgi:hypothetical protein
VHVRVNDSSTGKPTPCRIRFIGPDGQYYAPFGRLKDFATQWSTDVGGGNVKLGDKSYAYIDGTCEIALPPGPLTLEVNKGPEYTPLKQDLVLSPGKLTLRLVLNRSSDLRREGWYAGDCRAHFLSPHDALLEAAAEDLAVVNVLAFANWFGGRLTEEPRSIPGIIAFSGQQPILEKPGHLVVVNTLNTHRLGHLALLNCHRVVYPLSLKTVADFEQWSMDDWCDQCHRKGGLVVWSEPWPSGPDDPIGEPLAHLLRGKVDALETDGLAPNLVLLDQWYRLLNCGLRFPLVGSSGKSSNATTLGAVRTYARLEPGEEFTYKNWIEAVRSGRVFVTNGPLLLLTVENRHPGSVIDHSGRGSKAKLRAEVRSLFPLQRLELLANGTVIAAKDLSDTPNGATLEMEFPVEQSCWIAARCCGESSLQGGVYPQHVCAHTAPVYLTVENQPQLCDQESVSSVAQELDRILNWAEREGCIQTDRPRDRLAGIVRSARKKLLENR